MANDKSRVSSIDTKNWPAVISAIRGPLGIFALVILGINSIVLAVLLRSGVPAFFMGLIVLFLVLLLFFVVGGVFVIVWYKPKHLGDIISTSSPSLDAEMVAADPVDSEIKSIVSSEGEGVLFAKDSERPTLGFWFRELRPYLHQAAHYSVPTYYLDPKLNVVDWNIAFEVVFSELVGEIRGKHVNWLIARLANHDQVFDHARQFTKDVIEKHAFPYVDMEPICYKSQEYGMVRTVKVATQLTDTKGVGKGWAVALFPKEINWERFEEKVFARIHADKRWSIYSASYDRVLLKFPPYKTLIDDVVSVVPDGNLAVADLGAGTGNVTEALVNRGHRVTAIEDNLGMLDRFASKKFNPEVTNLIKSSVEHLEFVAPQSFDAVVMVNVLYALEHPLECMRSIHRMLRPDGVLGFSTTHRETHLDTLLKSIEKWLKDTGRLPKLAAEWDTVYKVNRDLEKSIVRRYTREEIREMLTLAGFDIIKEVRSTYEGAVMLIHARKRPPDSVN